MVRGEGEKAVQQVNVLFTGREVGLGSRKCAVLRSSEGASASRERMRMYQFSAKGSALEGEQQMQDKRTVKVPMPGEQQTAFQRGHGSAPLRMRPSQKMSAGRHAYKR